MVELKKIILSAIGVSSLFILNACNSGSTTISSTSTSGITYNSLSPGAGFSVITGARGVTNSTDVYLTGNYESETFLYRGPQTGGGTYYYNYNYPSSLGSTVVATSLYGPNNGNIPGSVQLVGSYYTTESGDARFGFLYQGPESGSTESANWLTLVPQSVESIPVEHTYAHSTMGNLVVGNYDTAAFAGGFIYDINTQTYYKIAISGALYTSIYGIWWNGESSYTIAGGYSNLRNGQVGFAYLADWNNTTHELSKVTNFNCYNQASPDLQSHFEGITGVSNGYNLAGDCFTQNGAESVATLSNIPRLSNGNFGTATWITVAYPGASLTSANTVFQSTLFGLYLPQGESVSNAFSAIVQ